MCLYTYPRLVKKGKEFGIFLCIQVNRIPMYGRVVLRFSPCLPNLFTVLLFHNKSISNVKLKLRLRSGFQPPARASAFECRNLFRVPQKITCSEQEFRKIRFANGLGLTEKTNRFHYKFRQEYLNNSYLQPRL